KRPRRSDRSVASTTGERAGGEHAGACRLALVFDSWICAARGLKAAMRSAVDPAKPLHDPQSRRRSGRGAEWRDRMLSFGGTRIEDNVLITASGHEASRPTCRCSVEARTAIKPPLANRRPAAGCEEDR